MKEQTMAASIRRLSTLSWLSTAILLVLIIGTQISVQLILHEQTQAHARTVLIGAQAKRSQILVKDALLVVYEPARAAEALAEMGSTRHSWEQAQEALYQGDDHQRIYPADFTSTVLARAISVRADYTTMRNAYRTILEARGQGPAIRTELAHILKHQAAYLAAFTEIQADLQALEEEHTGHAEQVELAVATLSVGTLLAKTLLIFSPGARRIKHALLTVEASDGNDRR